MQSVLDISVIIVNYKVEKELLECIASIKKQRTKASYEIIVVDNDEVKTLEKRLKQKYPDVRYIANPINNGWGGGINTGFKVAKGQYIYFLNPDTKLLTNALDVNLDFYRKHANAGVVSSLLFDSKEKPYPLQGTRELTPLRAVVVYSAFNKLFPDNIISQRFWYRNVDKTRPLQAEIVPLTASMISSELFKKAGMFDERYFLYFEEYDLQRRTNKLGCKSYLLPSSKVVHYWESSTKQITGRNKFLEQSRKYYFKKHFGKTTAKIVELLLRRNLKMLVIE